jgi:hypothetical protein
MLFTTLSPEEPPPYSAELLAIGRWTSPVDLPKRGLCDLLFVWLGRLGVGRRERFAPQLGLTLPLGD